MNPYDNPAALPPSLETAPPQRSWRGLGVALVALGFVTMLALGVFVGATMLSTAQAASGNANVPLFAQASTPGAHGARGANGQCDALTVSSVSGQTITAKAADGSTVTIHTSSSTTYTKAGQSASASAVTAGSQIHVQGPKNSDGSINATQIDVG
jgi:Domain of unknown function (DUF5666)